MIKDLYDGIEADGVYLVKSSSKSVTTQARPYLSIVLKDKTGEIIARKWNVTGNDEDIFKEGNIVKITGEVSLYKDRLQIVVKNGKVLTKVEYNLSDFISESKVNSTDLIAKLKNYIDSIDNLKIKRIVEEIILKRYYDKFIEYPAAVSVHHNYIRGLLEHTISMCDVIELMLTHYTNLNRDYLLAGALLHDIGKCEELSGNISTSYTLKGNLLGHISIGAMIIKEVTSELKITGDEVDILIHMVLSHHGKLEFGSPVLPITKESFLLSEIDNIDAKLNVLDKAMENIDSMEFSERIFTLDNKAFLKIDD